MPRIPEKIVCDNQTALMRIPHNNMWEGITFIFDEVNERERIEKEKALINNTGQTKIHFNHLMAMQI